MKLVRDNLWVTIVEYGDSEIDWISGHLAYDVTTHRGQTRKATLLDMVSAVRPRFPGGLLEEIQRAALKANVHLDVYDLRRAPAQADMSVSLSWLRPHQREALLACMESPNGIIHHATGAGKSATVAALALVYRVRWLVLVPTTNLVHQFAAEFERWASHVGRAEKAGKLGDGSWDVRRFTVATYQSMLADLRRPSPKFPWTDVQAVDFDECHLSAAQSVWRIATNLTGTYWRYGTSATAFERGDNKSLLVMAATGPVLHRADLRSLHEAGVLALPMVKFCRHRLPNCEEGEYADAYKVCVEQNALRDDAVLSRLRTYPRPWLIFVKTKTHGLAVQRALAQGGYRAAFVDKDVKAKDRKKAVDDMTSGVLDAVVATRVFYAGMDCPALRVVANLAGGSSSIDAAQRAGRGTRRKDKSGAEIKRTFDLLDVQDQGCGCAGYIHLACRWLVNHARSRRKAYLKAGMDVQEV